MSFAWSPTKEGQPLRLSIPAGVRRMMEASMTDYSVLLRMTKRWFFWPGIAVVLALTALKRPEAADMVANWLARHAVRIDYD